MIQEASCPCSDMASKVPLSTQRRPRPLTHVCIKCWSVLSRLAAHTRSVPCSGSLSAKAAPRHARAELHKLPAGLGFCSPLPEVCSVTLSQLFSLAMLSQFSGCKLGKIILLARPVSSIYFVSSSLPGLYVGLVPSFQQGCRPCMP